MNHECEATRELEALRAHIDAMSRLLTDDGHMTPHARRLFTQVIDAHKLQTITEDSNENQD